MTYEIDSYSEAMYTRTWNLGLAVTRLTWLERSEYTKHLHKTIQTNSKKIYRKEGTQISIKTKENENCNSKANWKWNTITERKTWKRCLLHKIFWFMCFSKIVKQKTCKIFCGIYICRSFQFSVCSWLWHYRNYSQPPKNIQVP